MESIQLNTIGTNIFRLFHDLEKSCGDNTAIGKRHLVSDRTRDAIVVREHLADILSGLQDTLENLLSIARDERLPFEQNEVQRSEASSPASDTESDPSDGSKSSNASSFHEVDFRLRSLTESLDALYSLATKIRNPRNRPQRTANQLYKNIPANTRPAYIQEREQIETRVVAYVQERDITENLGAGDLKTLKTSMGDVVAQYASPAYWLVRRTGVANARRKQQFVYWKEHAIKISQATSTPLPPATPETSHEQRPGKAVAVTVAASRGGQQSHATTATKLSAQRLKPDDLKSVISHHSRVSTVINPKGKKISWPPPPMKTGDMDYFLCPYCKILCPQRYLDEHAWQ